MRYFKVKNPKDLQIINPQDSWIFVNNSLITEKELDSFNLPDQISYFNPYTSKHEYYNTRDLFELVNISKSNTGFFMGFRFELSQVEINENLNN
jgi:hypothetical protein